jgi:hypothetical protein
VDDDGVSKPVRLAVGLAFGIAIGLVPQALTASPHQRVPLALVDFTVLFLSWPVHVVVHELGHLLAALAVRLPVLHVVVFGRRLLGRPDPKNPVPYRHMVRVNLDQAQSAQAPRMIAFSLAGPVANLALSVPVLVVGFNPSFPLVIRGAALTFGLYGISMGVRNLLPFRVGPQGHSDGAAVLRWLTSFRDLKRDLEDRQRILALGRVDVVQLRAAAQDPRPAVAGAAAHRLIRAVARGSRAQNLAALWAEAPLMVRVGRLEGVPHAQVLECCSRLSVVLAVSCVEDMVTSDVRPGDEQIALIAELAAAGSDAVPESVEATSAVALARVLQARPTEARDLLTGLALRGERAEVVARVYAVRAIAESSLGDRAQAERLLAAAERSAPNQSILHLARRYVDAGRQLVGPQDD